MISCVDLDRNKAKGMLMGTGHLIFLNWDQTAKDMLQIGCKSEGLILIYGEDHDHSREKVVKKIMYIMAGEFLVELIKREVVLLTEVHSVI